MERKVPLWVLILVIFLGLNLTVLYGWFVKESDGDNNLGKLESMVVQAASFPSLVKEAVQEVHKQFPSPMLVPNKFPDIEAFNKLGVLQSGALTDKGYLLLSTFDKENHQAIVKLIRIKDQLVLHQWQPNVNTLASYYKPDKDQLIPTNSLVPSDYRIGHPLLLKDGGLIFHNFEGPLYKINGCSGFEWINNGHFHHAIEQDIEGNIWVGTVFEPTHYDKNIFIEYRDDSIAKLSLSGTLLFKKSVSQILEENGYRGLLFGVGGYEKDNLHLNDVQPALYTTKYWKKDDLLLSMRNISTVMLYRPNTDKVIWLKTGPWLNQHDVNFEGESIISVFGNNIIRNGKNTILGGHNSVYKYDMTDNSVSMPYDLVLKALNVQTQTEGRQKHIKNGDIFIEEQNNGRILRLSYKKAIWEFTAAIDKESSGLLSWSRYLTEKEVKEALFSFTSLSCS